MFRVEKLDAWEEAISYCSLVYKVTQQLPDAERFGLTSQMRRSAVSVSANIAEGTSRATNKDFARFVEIAYGSLMESVSEAIVAREQRLVSEQDFDKLYQSAEKLARILSGLRSALLNSKSQALVP